MLLLAGSAVLHSAHADTCLPENPNGEYQLVFEENFDGDSLDPGKWNRELLWGPSVIINNEQQYYVNENQFGYDPFTVNNGTLTISAIKTPFDRSQLYLTSSIYSANSAELLWRVPAGATEYRVYRDGEFRGTATGGSFFDDGLDEGFDYAYEVEALDAFGNRIVSAQLTINTARRPQPPAPREPFSLKLNHRVYSADTAELLWQRPNRAGRFEIYRDGNLFTTLEGADFQSLYLTDLDAPENYTVIAYDRCDDVIIQDTITVDVSQGVTPPPAPVLRLKIEDRVYSKTTAELFWESVEGAVLYDIVEDSVSLGTTSARSWFVEGLTPGIDRAFTIIALDADGRVIDTESRTLNTADNSFALNRQPFLSGVITSYDAFRFLYGRVEMRAKMPQGKGLWSAFWLLNAYYNQDQPEDPEIDIIEAIGDQPFTAYQAYHFQNDNDGDGFHTDYTTTELSAPINDFSADFHTYRVDWSEGSVVWYIDGVETNRIEGPQVSNEQMYIILNLAVGGAFPGPADETTPFPSDYVIDYVRVWQR